jgi:hypothetical protein
VIAWPGATHHLPGQQGWVAASLLQAVLVVVLLGWEPRHQQLLQESLPCVVMMI